MGFDDKEKLGGRLVEGCQVLHRFDEGLLDTIYLVAIPQSFVHNSTYLFLGMFAWKPDV